MTDTVEAAAIAMLVATRPARHNCVDKGIFAVVDSLSAGASLLF